MEDDRKCELFMKFFDSFFFKKLVDFMTTFEKVLMSKRDPLYDIRERGVIMDWRSRR